jgi:hypothetical protein
MLASYPAHFIPFTFSDLSRDSTVSIKTGCGLDGRGVGVRVPVGSRNLSSLHVIQIGSGAHPASYEYRGKSPRE